MQLPLVNMVGPVAPDLTFFVVKTLCEGFSCANPSVRPPELLTVGPVTAEIACVDPKQVRNRLIFAFGTFWYAARRWSAAVLFKDTRP